MSKQPERRGELVQSASSDGWTIYEPATDSLHVLNDTARAIWELCDGSTTHREMAEAVSELTGLDLESAEQDVRSTLALLAQLNLVSA